MDDQLIMGILLIIVGTALGLIAVALVLNRRDDRIEQPVGDAEEEEVAEEEEEVEQPAEDEEEAESEDDEDEQEAEVDERDEADDLEPTAPRERNLVAEVYREEVTGRLIVRAGDHEYTDSRQIDDEGERRRLAYAASDFADWFQGEFEPSGRPVAAAGQAPAAPDQMLEEINEILQRSLVGTSDRGVRLFPDTAGGVKVFIGVKSYGIEDVPDKEIKDLIRQAVAEWEAGQ
ncbi:MAG: hypothetical protein ACE5JF_01090 [Anaerolineales bacterium]